MKIAKVVAAAMRVVSNGLSRASSVLWAFNALIDPKPGEPDGGGRVYSEPPAIRISEWASRRVKSKIDGREGVVVFVGPKGLEVLIDGEEKATPFSPYDLIPLPVEPGGEQ